MVSARASDIAISIHAPREGGDMGRQPAPALGGISIHAPREGGRPCTAWHDLPPFEFQSTPPARGATSELGGGDCHMGISIHAPREGGDRKDAQFYLRIFDK